MESSASLSYQHERAVKDELLLLLHSHEPTNCLGLAQFAQTWAQLSTALERVLSSSYEQDERAATRLCESQRRLREAEDDSVQLAFELATERAARSATSRRFATSLATLHEQLQDATQRADDALASIGRSRDHELHTALSAFESQQAAASERTGAATRAETRAADAHRQLEADERKRQQRLGTDLRDLLMRYDSEMLALDAALAAEQLELRRVATATTAFETHLKRLDDDHAHQVDEARRLHETERRRRHQELRVLGVVTRLQACVRGFLVRRRLRLARILKPRRRKATRKRAGTTVKTTVKPTTVKPTGGSNRTNAKRA